METVTQFNFRDVLRSPARALSAKQILVMTIFILVALAVYELFAYLAYAIDGSRLSMTGGSFGFFPFLLPNLNSIAAQGCFAVGLALSVLSLMLGFFGVAAINIEAIRGNRFFSAREAIKFAFRRFSQIFLAELSISMFVAFIVLLFVLLGLISRIPVIGEWIYTLLFALPNFIIALFSVFIIFVFTLTVLLLPAVAAAERKGETFSAILETFSTIILQPFRWAGYTAYSLVAAKVCGFIFAYFAYRAVQFLTWSVSIGGGEEMTRLVRSGLAHLPVNSDFVAHIFNLVPGVDFGITLYNQSGFPSNDAVSQVMAFMLFLIFVSILGYMLAIIATAQARGYVALRYMKDNYSIAAEEPLFFTEEPVNEEVAEGEGLLNSDDES